MNAEVKKESWSDILKLIPWKKIAYKVYYIIHPKLEKLVTDSASNWDDAALKAADSLVEKLLKD